MPAERKQGSGKRSPSDRHIRVFISSTFRDMHTERDHLVIEFSPPSPLGGESAGVRGESDTHRFAGTIETLNGHLNPIKPEARICQLLSKSFYGRQWLFEAVEKWRSAGLRPGTADNEKRAGSEIGAPGSESRLQAAPDRVNAELQTPERPCGSQSRLFWIMGAPGVGKSAFAAQLTHTRGDTVIAAQFCEWDKPDRRNAPRVVRSLAFQLSTRLPDYRKLLLTLPEIAELDRKDAAELFDYLLANPLRSVIHGGRERYLIVIDALDEAGEAGRNPLVEMLARNAQRLPDWLGHELDLGTN